MTMRWIFAFGLMGVSLPAWAGDGSEGSTVDGVLDLFGNCLILLVSCGFAILGTFGSLGNIWRARRATESADATVVALEEVPDSDGPPTYRAVFVFTVGGVEHRVSDHISTRPADYQIGDQVLVYFPPDAPDQAQIGLWRYLWPFLFIAFIGWALLITGLVWRFS
ncbi:MAG: DUF3592 domain-containing protein [Fimbriiglobus sp.]